MRLSVREDATVTMGTSRKITESQLDKAKAALKSRAEALKSKGVEAKKLKLDPKWRELDGKVRQVSARLRKVAELETTATDLAQHKIERQALLAQKQIERKAGLKKKRPDKKVKVKAKATATTKGPGQPKQDKGGKSDKGSKK
ncbi:MAG: hypothetical protein NT069_32880 [Planctomycetota bacterium]|nr:hypothetical protein [Planctomycetota bacterium]